MSRVSLMQLLLTLAIAALWASSAVADSPDIVSSSATSSHSYEEATKLKKIEGPSGLFINPGTGRLDLSRIWAGIKCTALLKGEGVKGAKILGGLDYVDANNAFQNIFTTTVKTNRNGDAHIEILFDAADPEFDKILDSIFLGFGTLGRSGKRADQLRCDGTVTAMGKPRRNWINGPGLDRDRYYILMPSTWQWDPSTNTLTTNSGETWTLELRDFTERLSGREVRFTRTSGGSENLHNVLLVDAFAADNYAGGLRFTEGINTVTLFANREPYWWKR